jgi:hypothetical protein
MELHGIYKTMEYTLTCTIIKLLCSQLDIRCCASSSLSYERRLASQLPFTNLREP